jgi:hypothetical protein
MDTAHIERAVWLTVDEVNQLVDALRNAKALKHLNGRQRKNLEDAIERLTEAYEHAPAGSVQLAGDVAVLVLRCVIWTQQWLGQMYDHLAGLD